MQNNLFSLLMNNDIKSAAKLFISFNDTELNEALEPVLEYLFKTKEDEDNIIDKMISMTEVAGNNEITIINGLLYNLANILNDAYIDDDETYAFKVSIFKIYEDLYNPLLKLYKSNENSYRLNIINWHSEFARYNFIFDNQDEAVKQWEISKKLCCNFLNNDEDDDENILSSLYLVYCNLGLAYSYSDNNEQALLNFLPYLFHLEHEMKYSDSSDLLMDFASVCKNTAAVCADENKDFYLIKALYTYRDYYKDHANDDEIQSVVDDIHEILNDLIEHFASIANYKSQYMYLKFRYDFTTNNLTINDPNILTMVHYMVAGYDLCKFFIIHKEFFEEKHTEFFHEASKTYSEKIDVPFDEINIYDYMLEYYDNVKSFYDKYNDYLISSGFASANLILGKYCYFANNPQKALAYLAKAKNILMEMLDDDREDLECIDKLYDVLLYQRNSYSADSQTENMIDIVNEMIELRKIAFLIDESDEMLLSDLAEAYRDAAEFCEGHNFTKMAKKFNESYNELIS